MRIGAYREPAGPGVRVDSGVGPGSEISPMYDPMVAKLIVWDADREQATRGMIRALREYEITEPQDADPVSRGDPGRREQWADAETCRDLIEDREWLKSTAPAAPVPARTRRLSRIETPTQSYTVEVSGQALRCKGDRSPRPRSSTARGSGWPSGCRMTRPAPKRGARAGERGQAPRSRWRRHARLAAAGHRAASVAVEQGAARGGGHARSA